MKKSSCCGAIAVPTQEFGAKGTYKLFGMVTNRKDTGDQVIWRLRERCGKSAGSPFAIKSDLAGSGNCRVRAVRRQRRMVGLDDPGA